VRGPARDGEDPFVRASGEQPAGARRVPKVMRFAGRLAGVAASIALWGLPSCKAKASPAQCDQLLDRYAALVVTEKSPDAAASQIDAERAREKNEAHGDDAFKNCSSEVSRSEFECAMRSPNAEAFLKCLE
jgi:hypothetical protein